MSPRDRHIVSESASHARLKVARQREMLARMSSDDPNRKREERVLATLVQNQVVAEIAEAFDEEVSR